VVEAQKQQSQSNKIHKRVIPFRVGEKFLKTNQKITCAVMAALGAHAGASYAAAETDASASSGIQEVLVTAQRRVESIQNVPITIQAITGDQLAQLSVSTIEDVLKYLPNVTFGTNGVGSGNIFMRGLSAGFQGEQSSATIAQFPNVATYLDDQSMTFPNRNLDIYMVDMERVEVLEGPQGTLFGGGAEAGAVRYITNKPKLNVTEGNVEASYGVTAGGDPNKSLNATLNLPLIADRLAVRAVIYDDRRGGYIDNVPSTFTRKNSDLGNFYAGVKPVGGLCPNGLPPGNGFCVPAGSPVVNNYSLAQRASNPVEIGGFRLTALYQVNDDWNALIAQSYQDMEADGEFTQFPTGSEGQALRPWQVTAFSPAQDKDRYENTSWTVNGKIGDLKALYTGGYLVRHIDQRNDYTNYARSAEGFYYSCSGGPAGGGALGAGTPPVCYSPITSWHDTVANTHQSHEFRLSTPDEWRLRGIVGAYWEDFQIKDDMNFLYKTIPSCTPANLAAALAGGAPCLSNVTTAPGSTAVVPGIRNDNTAFGEDAQRGYKQTAFFASIDYDLIPKVLTLTGGTRWYHYSEFETGSEYKTNHSAVDVANGACGPPCYVNINAENLNTTYSGFRSRGNLTWHITPDIMVYYTFSQGFRPGAFNRSQRDKATIQEASGVIVPQFKTPASYAPDSLTNNEIGWKAEFLDHRVQVNGSLYHMNWNNAQLLFYNPVSLGNTTFGVSGPDYTVDGLELQLVARVTDGLTLQGSGSWNRAKQTTSPCLISNEPGSPTLGQCITQTFSAGAAGNIPFQNPFGAAGARPAFSPAVEFNLRVRYDWTINEYKAWVMVGGNHVGDMSNNPATYLDGNSEAIPTTTFLRYDQPGYTTYNAALGVAKDNWTTQLYGTNLGNSDASVFTSSAQWIKAEVPLRPRVLGLTIGYKF
jgi:iron complex outermembrane receptor protein